MTKPLKTIHLLRCPLPRKRCRHLRHPGHCNRCPNNRSPLRRIRQHQTQKPPNHHQPQWQILPTTSSPRHIQHQLPKRGLPAPNPHRFRNKTRHHQQNRHSAYAPIAQNPMPVTHNNHWVFIRNSNKQRQPQQTGVAFVMCATHTIIL